MIIQVGHAKDSDFQNELYAVIKGSDLFHEHAWILPHDGKLINSKDSLKTVDIFIAEVSLPTTGLGIELGFANQYGIRILCISKKGVNISGSLRLITENFLEYENSEDMVEKIGNFIKYL